MPGMNEQETWDFLTEGTRTAHVATTRSDGRPHIKPVWFVLDGRPGDFQFLFTTYAQSVKGRGLRRNTQVAASVDDPAPPYSFVITRAPRNSATASRTCARRLPGSAAAIWARAAPPSSGPATACPASC